ncbi:hypothetical protein Lser_V15G19455 [Lactuca serriola]
MLTKILCLSLKLVSMTQSELGIIFWDHGSTKFFDQLRGLSTETLEPVENTTVVEKLLATQPTSHLSSKTELTSFNKLLMQRFPIPKMISVSLASGEVSSNIHLDELHDSQKLKEGGFKIVSHQEYIKRMHGLKDEIIRSWHSDDHVTTLKLSVKVARLLMDTYVAQFYPTLFVLGADIMDMLGDMVWDRIKQKVEFADDGTKICSLSGFLSLMTLMQIVYALKPKRHEIIGSEKLLPSMSFFHAWESLIFIFFYLELAILPC